MKNKKITKYNLTDPEKKELRNLRNRKRRGKLDSTGTARYVELWKNGAN